MKTILAGFVLALTLSSDLAVADNDLQSLQNVSQELVKIRQQIESLHNKISFEKESYKDQMRSYSNQKSDLDVKISRAELNIKDLQRELNKLAEINKQKTQAQQDITPVLKQAIEQLRTSVKNSIPFKLEQRLQALDDLEQRLDTHVVSPNKAANQLWAFVEDELMLGKSSGIYNETINIDGQDRLVKVLRIGKMAMFYKTHDGRYGVTKKMGGQWQQQSLNDSDSAQQLEQLFDSFGKNIRNGQFTIPNFLPKS